MAKFALFSFEQYYPSGGMDDYVGSFDTKEAAEKIASVYDPPGYSLCQFRQVVDCASLDVVSEWVEEFDGTKNVVRAKS